MSQAFDFNKIRSQIIGIDQDIETPFGTKRMVYTDWTASGRLYRPIEEKMLEIIGPYVANTHTETTASGTAMTLAYHKAKHIIKDHVNAHDDDVLINSGTGMTGVINKFQRILGLRIPENIKNYTQIPDELRPIVFISHMEHHSNHTSWLETIADLVVIPPDETGLFSLANLQALLEQHSNRQYKIASITACSNVTGITTPFHEVAQMMHQKGGLCFVDFACSGPYVKIDMHPSDEPEAYLDAVFLSPHKFLGGPGTSGVLLFNKNLYKNIAPDCPGGGTVRWTDPWGHHLYIDNIEDREDGGTPGFLQVIRTALAIRLKEEMGIENILSQEHVLVDYLFERLGDIENIHVLAGQHKDRLGVFSFHIQDLHYNLGVKLLNDRYGIQTRGGCSCAGTYGHYLFHLDEGMSDQIKCSIDSGDYTSKPGWIRLSIHPTLTMEEIKYACDAVLELAKMHKDWAEDYVYDNAKNEFRHKLEASKLGGMVEQWFA